MRLDQYLAQYYPEKSRSAWQKHILAGVVTINGEMAMSAKQKLGEDDEVKILEAALTSPKENLPVIYSDDNIIVINKPAGILSHAKGGIIEEQTVANFIKDKTTYGTETNRPGIVHRLDRDTSGVIVTVRNPETAKLLQRQFTDRKVKKSYIAIVKGSLKHTEANIDLPIERNPKIPSQFRVGASGKEAFTSYKVLDQHDDLYLVKLQPTTGRTHQLRVHMAYIGAPILGDKVYGRKTDRMFLHALSIEITIPSSKRVTFQAPLPTEFEKLFPGVAM